VTASGDSRLTCPLSQQLANDPTVPSSPALETKSLGHRDDRRVDTDDALLESTSGPPTIALIHRRPCAADFQ